VTAETASTPLHLGLNQLRPSVHLAGCYHFRRDVSFQYRIPSHHLILIESGRIEAKTKNESFEAKAGDLICFPPAEWNEYKTHGPTLFYQAHIQFAQPPRHKLTPFLEGVGLLPTRVPLGEYFEEARILFESLCLEVTRVGVVHHLRMRAAIYELLAIIASVAGPESEAVQQLDPWLRMQQRLDATLNRDWRVEELASQMGLSTEHFIRQFKHHFGISPKAYHTRARLQEAARSLRGSLKSVKAVAYAMGFNDPKSFTRRFKQHLGVRPSDLRLHPKSEAVEGAATKRAIFPLNVHLLPPQSGTRALEQYFPKNRSRASRLPEPESIMDKLRHPEKYV
jgi:AraC family transcriptional regulator of arabinose operon